MMEPEYILVDLRPYQKKLILRYAEFVISDEQTKKDLRDKTILWVRFASGTIFYLNGELSYRLNKCRSLRTMELLDELISHLEYYEK